MVGRDRDLAALLEVAEVARRGAPRLALVTGEAGIGKSRLVQEFSDRISDALVVTGHGVDVATGDLPFGVLTDSLADLVRQRGVDVLADADRSLLGPLLPGTADQRADPARLLAGAAALFSRLAGEGLVCWVVEDLQWTDQGSQDLVNLIGRRQAGRILVVATVRTSRFGEAADEPRFAGYLDDLMRLPSAESFPLQRLTADEVRRQLSGLSDEPLPTDVVRLVVDLGDGVPFVVEELAAAHGRAGLTTVAAVAGARLGALSGGARRLVEAAALGEGLLVWALLEVVVGLAPDELDEAVLAAVRAGVLEDSPARDGVRFRHALLRDAVDRSIPPAARRGWHRRWAEVIDGQVGVLPEDLAVVAAARHWHLAGDVEKSAAAAFAATGVVGRTGGPREELALWQRLMDLWPDVCHVLKPMGVDRHLVLTNVLRFAKGIEGEDAHTTLLVREEERAVDDLERSAIRLRRYTDTRAKGSLPEIDLSPEQLEEWEALFRGALPDPLAVDSLAHLSAVLPADDPRAMRLLEEARATATRSGDERIVLLIRARQAFHWQAQGHPETSVEQLREAIAGARTRNTFELWSMEGNLMWCLGIAGRYAEVEQVADAAFARVPDPVSTGVHFEHIVENACFSWINTGQWARAEELVCRARPYWGPGMWSSELRLAEIELMRTGALADVARWRTAIETGSVQSGAADPIWIHELLAWHHAMSGDLPGMRALLTQSWSATNPSVLSDVLWSPVLLAARHEAAAAVRDVDPADRPAAERHIATIQEVAGRLHRFGRLGNAWDTELTAQLARFHGEECQELFEAAVAEWDAVGHPYDGALARLCLAEATVAESRGSARRYAEQALRTARDLGAGPLGRDVEVFLKRYRLATSAVDTPGRPGSLTPREREVLQVLAEGRTNEQIAATLFMSPKTASVHVSRILAKLEVSNRTEAAAVARRVGLL